MTIFNFKKMAHLMVTASMFFAATVQAAPLALSTPSISFDSGTTNYTSADGSFSFNSLPTSFFDPTVIGGPPLVFIGSSASTVETVSVNIVLDSVGTLFSGTAGDDLVIEGRTVIIANGIPTVHDGILLTGEISSFESGASAVSTNDTYNLIFTVTGGTLSGYYPGGYVGINLTSESSTATGDFTVDFNGGAKGQLGGTDVIVLPDACTVEVSATCLVDTPATAMLCEAKIAATTLMYTGPSMYGIDVSIVGSSGGNVTYTNINLETGDILTAATEAGMTVDARPLDLGSKTTITIDGVVEIIHTSCSAIYSAGVPAPLDNPKGDPSPNWTVVSFVDKNGKVVDSTPIAPSSICEIPPSGAGCFANGKPTSLTFEYTGGGCALSDSEALTAGVKPPTCMGAIDESLITPNDSVEITAAGLTITPSTVVLGDTFTVTGYFDSSTTIVMTDAMGGTETSTFHTSCSAPLEVGDVFGGMTITLFNGEVGGTTVDFFYKVTNTGDTIITDVILDDVFESSIPGNPIETMLAGEMQTLTQTVSLINSVENPVTVSALSGAAVCDGASSVTIHETARLDKGSKGSKGSKRGSKKMKKKQKKGSHKRHKRSKGGHKKGSKGKGHYSGKHDRCSH